MSWFFIVVIRIRIGRGLLARKTSLSLSKFTGFGVIFCTFCTIPLDKYDGWSWRPTTLKQPADALMSKVMKMQVRDAEELAPLGETGADGFGVEGKDPFIDFRLLVNDGPGLIGQVDPAMVTALLIGVLHVRHDHALSPLIQISPSDPRYLLLAAR